MYATVTLIQDTPTVYKSTYVTVRVPYVYVGLELKNTRGEIWRVHRIEKEYKAITSRLIQEPLDCGYPDKSYYDRYGTKVEPCTALTLYGDS